jgi:hypothetical protein
MATVKAPGGGLIDSGDKRVERKVVVSTSGRPQAPGGLGILTAAAITEEPGGIQRGVFEYTEGGLGDASYNQYGKRIEFMGGSREVPIFRHPFFKDMTVTEIETVQKDVEKKVKGSGYNTAQSNLYECLIRKIEYFLAPSLVARVSEIESALPSVEGLCKIESPQGVANAPDGSVWLLTGVSASPVGGKFEVTREYTMSPEPEATRFLYS